MIIGHDNKIIQLSVKNDLLYYVHHFKKLPVEKKHLNYILNKQIISTLTQTLD